MSRAFRLATVLRVRQVQTDLARGQVGAAHQARAVAASDVARREADLRTHRTPVASTSPAAAVAALTGGVARAQELHAAAGVLADRDEQVAASVAQWQSARVRARALELLAERHAARLAAADAAVAQRAADDRAAAIVAARRTRSGAKRGRAHVHPGGGTR